jgi:hypothetical protein
VVEEPSPQTASLVRWKTALLTQPSSAAEYFPYQKDSEASALEDNIETSLMVQYNEREYCSKT